MPWVKLDDDFFDHIKAVRAGRDARDLFLAGLLYASKSLTDGFITADILGHIAGKAGVSEPEELAPRLVTVNLWEEAAGGWLIHDYHDYNPTAEKVRADRKAAADRMKRSRENGKFSIVEDPPIYNGSSAEVRANILGTSDDLHATPAPFLSRSPDPGKSDFSAEKSDAAASAPPIGLRENLEARIRASSNRRGVLGDIYEELFGKPVDRDYMGKIVKEAKSAGVVLDALLEAFAGQTSNVDDPLDYVHSIALRKIGRARASPVTGRAVDAQPANVDYTLPPAQEALNAQIQARSDARRAARDRNTNPEAPRLGADLRLA